MRVLVVEDEIKMAALLKQGLEEQNHSVEVAHNGHEAVELGSDREFDVIVLDVMLPGLDGFEVARRLRKNQKQTPILMLTARDARGTQEIHLTATEYRLLEFMMRRPGRVLPRASIIEGVWGFNENIEDNTLEAFVSSLRNKIDRGFDQKLIHTIRSVGYCVRQKRS